jgi:UDP-N-acetylglucosamine 2-epimerase (non-hydrolysing)
MIAYERACLKDRPHWTVVVGDVNSTVACALAATKLGVRVAHLEAGLRSRDRSMPEEINRIVTDAIADLLWTPSPDADVNLRHEGVPGEKIERVGNIMIDSLELVRSKIEARRFYEDLELRPGEYGVVTLHRPVNVDRVESLAPVVQALAGIANHLPLVFPVHPRTQRMLQHADLARQLQQAPRLRLIDPVGYIEFMSLVFSARLAITDSGGIQEETTYLGVPCLTLRESTERPITVTVGTNQLVTIGGLPKALEDILNGKVRKGRIPDLWDGHTATRVVKSLRRAALRP